MEEGERTEALCEGVQRHDRDHEEDFAQILSRQVTELEILVLLNPGLGPDHKPAERSHASGAVSGQEMADYRVR
eukprot:3844442-Rhodomonas_salina.3